MTHHQPIPLCRVLLAFGLLLGAGVVLTRC
jgi:hypothetical protein